MDTQIGTQDSAHVTVQDSFDRDSFTGQYAQFQRRLKQAKTHEQSLTCVGTFVRHTTDAKFVSYLSVAAASNQVVQPENTMNLTVVHCDFEKPGENLQHWASKVALKAVVTERPCVESAGDRSIMIGVPVSDGENTHSAIAALYIKDSDSVSFELSTLNSVGNAIESWQTRQSARIDYVLATDTAAINEINAELDQSLNLQQACNVAADELQSYIDSLVEEAEAPGPVRIFLAPPSKIDRLSVAAVSESEPLPENSREAEFVEATMGEVVCQNQALQWPSNHGQPQAMMCHQRLARELDSSHVYSFPLRAEGSFSGALVLLANSALTNRQLQFCRAFTGSLGSRLQLIQRAEKSRWQKFIASTMDSISSNKGATVLKLAGLAGLIACVPIPYRLNCNSEISPVARRFVCAPFESRLSTCRVEPGDLVTANQVLGELDDEQIRLELLANEAELHRATRDSDGYIASHQSGEALLAQLEADRLTARNQLLAKRIDHLVIRSPIDGVVIAGDLKDSLGRPLDQGEALFEIAPLDQLVLELQVPEEDIRFVEKGMSVSLQLDAFPFQVFNGTVSRVHPASETRDDKNVFIAIAELEQLPQQSRPGMTGSASIRTVWRPIGWVYLHKPASAAMRWFGW